MLNNQTFTTCYFKRKNQIKTLQRFYLSISVEQGCVGIDLLTLFLRLLILGDQKFDTGIEDCFYYELIPYPFSLSKGGLMRTGKNKSMLKNFLLEGVLTSERTDSNDGGALLWSCNWLKGGF